MTGNKTDAGTDAGDIGELKEAESGAEVPGAENRVRQKRKLTAAKYCVNLLANETLTGRAAYEVMQALVEKVPFRRFLPFLGLPRYCLH
jgi:hypothetical protein